MIVFESEMSPKLSWFECLGCSLWQYFKEGQGRQAIGCEAVLSTLGPGWFSGLLVYGHAVWSSDLCLHCHGFFTPSLLWESKTIENCETK